MEAIIFMFDSLAIVLIVFMGLRDDRRGPGQPHTSLFRMTAVAVSASAAAPAKPAADPWDPEPDWLAPE